MNKTKQLMLSQRDTVEIVFWPEDVILGNRLSGLEARFSCVPCGGHIKWNLELGMFQCVDCGYDLSREEAIDLTLDYRARLDCLLGHMGVQTKKSFFRRLLDKIFS